MTERETVSQQESKKQSAVWKHFGFKESEEQQQASKMIQSPWVLVRNNRDLNIDQNDHD